MKSPNSDLSANHRIIPDICLSSPVIYVTVLLTSPSFPLISSIPHPMCPLLCVSSLPSFPHVSPQVLPLVGALTEKLTLCSETISIRRYLSITSSTYIRVHLQYLSSFIPNTLHLWSQLLITVLSLLLKTFVSLAFAKPFSSPIFKSSVCPWYLTLNVVVAYLH